MKKNNTIIDLTNVEKEELLNKNTLSDLLFPYKEDVNQGKVSIISNIDDQLQHLNAQQWIQLYMTEQIAYLSQQGFDINTDNIFQFNEDENEITINSNHSYETINTILKSNENEAIKEAIYSQLLTLLENTNHTISPAQEIDGSKIYDPFISLLLEIEDFNFKKIILSKKPEIIPILFDHEYNIKKTEAPNLYGEQLTTIYAAMLTQTNHTHKAITQELIQQEKNQYREPSKPRYTNILKKYGEQDTIDRITQHVKDYIKNKWGHEDKRNKDATATIYLNRFIKSTFTRHSTIAVNLLNDKDNQYLTDLLKDRIFFRNTIEIMQNITLSDEMIDLLVNKNSLTKESNIELLWHLHPDIQDVIFEKHKQALEYTKKHPEEYLQKTILYNKRYMDPIDAAKKAWQKNIIDPNKVDMLPALLLPILASEHTISNNENIVNYLTRCKTWFDEIKHKPKNIELLFMELREVLNQSDVKRTLTLLNRQEIINFNDPDVIYQIFKQGTSKSWFTMLKSVDSNKINQPTSTGVPAWWGVTHPDKIPSDVINKINFESLNNHEQSYIQHLIAEQYRLDSVDLMLLREKVSFYLDNISNEKPININIYDDNGNNLFHHLLTVKTSTESHNQRQTAFTTINCILKHNKNHKIESALDLLNSKNNEGSKPIHLLIENNFIDGTGLIDPKTTPFRERTVIGETILLLSEVANHIATEKQLNTDNDYPLDTHKMNPKLTHMSDLMLTITKSEQAKEYYSKLITYRHLNQNMIENPNIKHSRKRRSKI